jgi:hypothetical protein
MISSLNFANGGENSDPLEELNTGHMRCIFQDALLITNPPSPNFEGRYHHRRYRQIKFTRLISKPLQALLLTSLYPERMRKVPGKR